MLPACWEARNSTRTSKALSRTGFDNREDTGSSMADAVFSPATLGSLILLLACLSSYPALSRLMSTWPLQRPNYRANHLLACLFTDEDGTATHESQKAYFTALPSHLALAGTTSGLVLSFTMAIIVFSDRSDENGHYSLFLLGTWVRNSLIYLICSDTDRSDSGLHSVISVCF